MRSTKKATLSADGGIHQMAREADERAHVGARPPVQPGDQVVEAEVVGKAGDGRVGRVAVG